MTLNPITRILAGRTAKMVIGILVIVEAVFVSESFTTLLEITLEFGGGAWDLATLLLLKMPEIIDFGLPLAMVIGFYFAITTARDNSELIVCAAAGVSWSRLPLFAFQIGVIGFLTSILISGYGVPLASYAKRIAIAQMYSTQITRQLLNPSADVTIQEMNGNTVITLNGVNEGGAPKPNLFVYHPQTANKGDESWHVSLAQDWVVSETDEAGHFRADLLSFTDYSGSSSDQPMSITQVNSMSMTFELDDLLRKVDRARRKDEVFLVALAEMFATSDGGGKTVERAIFGEKLARALLCPVAAALALFGAAFSQYKYGRLTALPLALIGVLGADILSREILSTAAIAGILPLILAALGVAFMTLTPPAIFLFFNGEKVIFPLKDPVG